MFSTGSAARTRRFVEQRLDETRRELSAAQDSLQEFQREHGALAVDEQTRTTVAVIAKLQGESEALKAKRDAMRFSMSDRSSEMRSLDAQIAAMEERVRSLVAPGVKGETGAGVLLKLQDVPGLAAEYAQLLLAVETQAAVFGMLAQQVEQAKIEETRNTPTVRILDRASVPLYRSRPRNKLNMAVGFVLGCALAFVAILALDRLAPQAGSEGNRWRTLLGRSPLSSAA
jgi:capsule polysaccharide export protein KpsE/RkpR